jgi:hypothetical protein
VLGSCFPNQVRHGFVSGVAGEGDEANAYDSETQFFVSFSTLNIGINRHSPEQRGTGCDLNETIHSETDKRDAPCNYSSRDSDQPFEAIPHDCEILQPPSAMGHYLARDGQFSHFESIPVVAREEKCGIFSLAHGCFKNAAIVRLRDRRLAATDAGTPPLWL